ncbi:protein translocase subunit secE/sec61 gamma [Thermosyntropha lipolytica DSM 11003]|uniref:Protein translocase subunit SecE n=1 Tax=Thermosyntropha lipolytica DSM 11003 TaxID=1123382 RepID=A0A1M5QTN6_9FIRM|nr:preprotein translocase subunit SecE [Thermosyntropha lipolytica]SHH17507.1 protein translocase subunit secE/sec61 gamma [Thermosyntropha lipolytica DSM 11003]
MAKENVPVKKEENRLAQKINSAKEYLLSSYNELKKVHWPNRTQLIGYTGVVLFTVLLVGLIIWLFDSGLSFVLEKLFKAMA